MHHTTWRSHNIAYKSVCCLMGYSKLGYYNFLQSVMVILCGTLLLWPLWDPTPNRIGWTKQLRRSAPYLRKLPLCTGGPCRRQTVGCPGPAPLRLASRSLNQWASLKQVMGHNTGHELTTAHNICTQTAFTGASCKLCSCNNKFVVYRIVLPGPGDTKTPLGFIACTSATVLSSFFITTYLQPKSPRYCMHSVSKHNPGFVLFLLQCLHACDCMQSATYVIPHYVLTWHRLYVKLS